MNEEYTNIPHGHGQLARLTQSSVILIAVLFGMVMPIISAMIYPTYRHKMSDPWVEATRLLELPFVAAEVAIILFAMLRGMSMVDMWRGLPNDVRFASLVMLIGVFTSSALFSAEVGSSLVISLITFFHLMFALAALYLSRGVTLKTSESFANLHAVGLVLIALLTAWWLGFPPPLSEVPEGKIEWSNAVPGWISVRHFGSWTGALAAAFAIKLLFEDKDRLDWTQAAYCLAAAMTVWSGTRAAILAIVAVTLIIVVATRQLPNMRAIFRAALLTGIAMLAAWLLLPDHPAFWLYQTGDLESLKTVTSKRDELWLATFYRWLDSPWWGWGSGSTNWEVDIGWAHTQPHNAILQFLISWGIVGAAGAIWLIARAIKAVHSRSLHSPIQLALLAMLYALLFQSMLEGMLHYPRFIIAIIMLFALLARLAEPSSLGERPEERLPAN